MWVGVGQFWFIFPLKQLGFITASSHHYGWITRACAVWWSYKMGNCRKNPNGRRGGGGWGYNFLKNRLEFFIFLLEIPDKTKLIQPLDIPQNCVWSLGNSKAKNKDPGNSTVFLLVTLGNSTLFLINPWKFHMLFLGFFC